MVHDRLPPIRAACAAALAEGVSADSTIAKLLFNRLGKDKSDVVCAQCAQALRLVAPKQAEVRVRLEELFKSGPELVRAGAARGLSRLDFTSPEQRVLLEQFLTTIAASAEPPQVRCASLWAIAAWVGHEGMAAVDRVVEECLEGPSPRVRQVALHVLADAIAEGRKEWSQPLVEKIETMLLAVTTPCHHLFDDLVTLVALKEIHGGQRLERLFGDALSPFGDLIRIAFVFRSVARLEQVRDSDVDLMILGGVRLKELAAALRTREQLLGRIVNPVLFSPERFGAQYREGNPFQLDVVRKEKMFLKGSRDELTELVADRSPDRGRSATGR